MAEAGRPTDLTKEVIAKIKEAILDGKTLKDFAESSGISYSTITGWTYKNQANLSDRIEGWKRDRKLLLAERNLEDDMMLDATELEARKVRQKASMFVAETLGKDKGYSKRNELTGADGKDLPTPILGNAYVHNDDSHKEDNADEIENSSDTGGHLSEQDDKHTPLFDTLSTERRQADVN